MFIMNMKTVYAVLSELCVIVIGSHLELRIDIMATGDPVSGLYSMSQAFANQDISLIVYEVHGMHKTFREPHVRYAFDVSAYTTRRGAYTHLNRTLYVMTEAIDGIHYSANGNNTGTFICHLICYLVRPAITVSVYRHCSTNI